MVSEARDLVCKCLTFDPFGRLQLEKVLNHPWFNAKDTDWYNIAVDISLAYPIKNINIDEEQHDEDSDVIADCEAGVQAPDNCRKESGVESGSNSFEKNEQSNNNNGLSFQFIIAFVMFCYCRFTSREARNNDREGSKHFTCKKKCKNFCIASKGHGLQYTCF